LLFVCRKQSRNLHKLQAFSFSGQHKAPLLCVIISTKNISDLIGIEKRDISDNSYFYM